MAKFAQGLEKFARQIGQGSEVFELGYFSGVFGRGRGRVCFPRKGDVEIPSDLYVVYMEMDDAEGWKQRLVMELKAAQLDFDANRLWG